PHTGDNRDRDVGSRFLPSGGLLLPTGWPVNPFRGKTTDRRAGCGKSARPVRREGERQSRSPYPYLFVFISKQKERFFAALRMTCARDCRLPSTAFLSTGDS